MIALVIRLNDITVVAQDFSKFKDECVSKIGQSDTERFEGILDNYFKQLIEQANMQAEVVALFIIRSDI